jgi:hypothetical protein
MARIEGLSRAGARPEERGVRRHVERQEVRSTSSTWANATCPSPWVDRLLDHRIGGVAGTYNLYEYAEQKRYVAHVIENTVREALGMKPIALPPRPLA